MRMLRGIIRVIERKRLCRSIFQNVAPLPSVAEVERCPLNFDSDTTIQLIHCILDLQQHWAGALAQLSTPAEDSQSTNPLSPPSRRYQSKSIASVPTAPATPPHEPAVRQDC